MKKISLSMTDKFKVSLLCRNNVYQLENNSTLINIECAVDSELTYKMHISHNGEKTFLVMDKNEDSISKLLTAPTISSNGIYYIQLEGIKDDYRIISNQIRLEIGSFINAEHIPTPEEQSVIDEILIRVNTIDEEISDLNEAITQEAIDRAQADSSLQDSFNSAIEQERAIRANADANLQTAINGKQDELVAGENITITGNVISATGGGGGESYIAGDNITIEDKVISAIVPTKVSELVNDEGFVDANYVQQALSDKMEFYKVGYTGSHFEHEGIALTYSDLIAKYNDPQYFLYVEYAGLTYIPALPPLEGDEILEFVCTWKYGGQIKVSRLIINSQNQIKDEDDIIALNSEVTELKANLSELPTDVQINGVSILDDNKVANIPIASNTVSGVIKSGNGTYVSGGGVISGNTQPYSGYLTVSNPYIIAKGTLENVLDNETVRVDKSQSLSDEQKLQAQTNLGVENKAEVFIAEYGVTTAAEIIEAYEAGKLCYAVNHTSGNVNISIFSYYTSSYLYFFSVASSTGYNIVIVNRNTNAWANNGYSIERDAITNDSLNYRFPSNKALSAYLDSNALRVDKAQTFTDEQKAQAQTNLGILSSEGVLF